MSKLVRTILTLINKMLPKFEKVTILAFPNTESGAIAIANYIAKNSKKPVYYVISKEDENPAPLLEPGIVFVKKKSKYDFEYLISVLTSKYIFFTHGTFLDTFSSKQIAVNLWHGLLYKKVGLLIGKSPVKATITVGTSKLSQKMFSEAFGVSIESVSNTGYPRNDLLQFANRNKLVIKNNVGVNADKKIIIWMPTFRTTERGVKLGRYNGIEVGNPFYVKDFDVAKFDKILEKLNAFCYVKPHPLAPKYNVPAGVNNLCLIDDAWILDKKITLYEFIGISDVLISDVSSVIIDYLLINQPIICLSADFEEYKRDRGFYFQDIENWFPSRILKSQEEFFGELECVFIKDEFKERREILKKQFFSNQDEKSTERLFQLVFK